VEVVQGPSLPHLLVHRVLVLHMVVLVLHKVVLVHHKVVLVHHKVVLVHTDQVEVAALQEVDTLNICPPFLCCALSFVCFFRLS